MYKLELTNNQYASLDYFDNWLRINHNATYKGFTVGVNLAIYFNVELIESDKTDIQDFYTALTASDIMEINPMQAAFDKAEVDGRDYFKFAKAKYFGVKLQNGTLTYTNLSYVYTRLNEVGMRLNNGDQGLALHFLQNEFGSITQTDIDNGYTQSVHDDIINDLTTYINNVV